MLISKFSENFLFFNSCRTSPSRCMPDIFYFQKTCGSRHTLLIFHFQKICGPRCATDIFHFKKTWGLRCVPNIFCFQKICGLRHTTVIFQLGRNRSFAMHTAWNQNSKIAMCNCVQKSMPCFATVIYQNVYRKKPEFKITVCNCVQTSMPSSIRHFISDPKTLFLEWVFYQNA